MSSSGRCSTAWADALGTAPARTAPASSNRLLLAYKQVHFEMSKLFARRIRKCIVRHGQANRTIYGPALHQEIAGLPNEKSTLNTNFDVETYRNQTRFS